VASSAQAKQRDRRVASSERRGIKQIWFAFVWSMQGLKAAFRHEASFRLELYLALVVIGAGLWLGDGGIEKLLLGGSPLLVLSAELLNSAIETVVDKVSPGYDELAGRAKDMGSAATFVLMVLVVLTWVLILGSRYW
jgi:diacylglycerol kinase (ATP)